MQTEQQIEHSVKHWPKRDVVEWVKSITYPHKRDRILMLFLASRVDQFGRCRVSQDTIANALGVTRRSVVTAVVRLAVQGRIQQTHKHGRQGYRTASEYQLNVNNEAFSLSAISSLRQDEPKCKNFTAIKNRSSKYSTQEVKEDNKGILSTRTGIEDRTHSPPADFDDRYPDLSTWEPVGGFHG